MSKIESAIQFMEETARDNSHGYCQTHRWGKDGDYDCSALVITAWERAGVKVKSMGASYTGNILDVFKKAGFKDVTSSVNLRTGSGLKRGDVLLRTGHHVAMYCGNGKEVEASINEKGTATGGKPGDQTGREILIRSYRNYPWNHVLRYVETTSVNTTASHGKSTASNKPRFTVSGTGTPNRSKQFSGVVRASVLNTRKWAGTNYGKCSLKLYKGDVVDVCDSILDKNGDMWYYICYNNKHAFVLAKYVD